MEKRWSAVCNAFEKGHTRTLVPLLPMVFQLNGRPYSLHDFFPMEPIFQTRLPRVLTLKTARQVSKSTCMAARSILISAIIPNFSTIFVTPLFEQARRFSTQYVRPFIDNSLLRSVWKSANTESSVLQKSFMNGSRMFFSFAYLDADRIRGLSGHLVGIDEVQDMDANHIPVIMEAISASERWRLQMLTGTPKSMDGTLQGLWEHSSQAEWVIRCGACHKYNIPSVEHDLLKMIGPYRDDICEERPGTICANSSCQKPIRPREGRWVHKHKDLRWSRPGYHIPQIIMPMHCRDPERWSELLAKQQGAGNMTTAKFYNEVLGESYDEGSKLLTETDLQNAATLPWENNKHDHSAPLARLRHYDVRILGVDWGGGGEAGVSFTVAAVLGMRGDRKIDVLYGERSLTPHDHVREAAWLMDLFREFGCSLLAHDYNGAGTARETIMMQAGLTADRLLPFVYHRSSAQHMVVHKPPLDSFSRPYWQLDKARSLVTTCQAIKMGLLHFFQYDRKTTGQPGLLHDFLALVENKIATSRGPEIYTIQRNASLTDDFAHAVNFGACGLWHHLQAWPNFAAAAGLQLDATQSSAMYPDYEDDY